MSRAASATVAATVSAATAAALRRREPHVPGWSRSNFRDRPVTLAGGPALAAGVVVSAAVARAPGAVVAGATGAALGLYDDLRGDSHARGLRGHWRAAREGRVTTGMVKLVGLVAGGVVAARVSGRNGTVATVVDASLVAGVANLVNLLDLRPGRALKVLATTAAAAAASSRPHAPVPAGLVAAAAVRLPADLAEREMIGDCGANAAGAVLGWWLGAALDPVGRGCALVAVVALTAASERVSFSQVIAGNRWLRAVDSWGRTP